MAIRTTAIVNLKGGVAKTTTVINMAAILAREYGSRVLVIDADSQCNATEFFGGNPDHGNLGWVLRDVDDYPNPGVFASTFIQPTDFEHISLLPASESLMDLDLSKVEAGTVNCDVIRYLVEEVNDKYDHILIDCPPAFNAASAAALVAADDVIIPIKLDAFSLRGMVNLMRQVRNMRNINPRLQVSGTQVVCWIDLP